MTEDMNGERDRVTAVLSRGATEGRSAGGQDAER
jgi:hypothetical protein